MPAALPARTGWASWIERVAQEEVEAAAATPKGSRPGIAVDRGPLDTAERLGAGMHWVFWALVGAAAAHVLEEWLAGWSRPAVSAGRRFVSVYARRSQGIGPAAFAAINAFVLLLCVAGALAGFGSPAFSLSVAVLFIINAAMHLVPMAAVRRYSPGAASALLLCLPLAVYAFRVAEQCGKLTAWNALGAFLLGWLWHALPAAVAFLSSAGRGA